MAETFESSLSGRKYKVNDMARVADQKLQTLYIKAGLKPIEVLPGVDNNGKDIIIMYFLRDESNKYYDMWRNHTLSDYLSTIDNN